jgi:quercetin dioxygenase-like cupin family protein
MMIVSSEKNAQPELIGKGVKRRLMHLDNLMTVVIDFQNPMERPDPPHSHPHEQITYVASGELWFFIGQDKYRLSEGDMIKIPSGLPHTIQTISSNVRLIDSFSPVRKDFLKD